MSVQALTICPKTVSWEKASGATSLSFRCGGEAVTIPFSTKPCNVPVSDDTLIVRGTCGNVRASARIPLESLNLQIGACRKTVQLADLNGRSMGTLNMEISGIVSKTVAAVQKADEEAIAAATVSSHTFGAPPSPNASACAADVSNASFGSVSLGATSFVSKTGSLKNISFAMTAPQPMDGIIEYITFGEVPDRDEIPNAVVQLGPDEVLESHIVEDVPGPEEGPLLGFLVKSLEPLPVKDVALSHVEFALAGRTTCIPVAQILRAAYRFPESQPEPTAAEVDEFDAHRAIEIRLVVKGEVEEVGAVSLKTLSAAKMQGTEVMVSLDGGSEMVFKPLKGDCTSIIV